LDPDRLENLFSPSQISKGMEDVRQMSTLRELRTTFENRMPSSAFRPQVESKDLK
jgi:hypothetical protein